MRYTITNRTNGRLGLPAPIGGTIGANKTIVKDIPAHLMERMDNNSRDNKMSAMINAGLISIAVADDPNTPAEIEVIPKSEVGSAGTALVLEDLSAQADGIATTFNTGLPYVAGTLKVWFAGIFQTGTPLVTESNPAGGQFTLSVAVTSNATDRLFVEYEKVS